MKPCKKSGCKPGNILLPQVDVNVEVSASPGLDRCEGENGGQAARREVAWKIETIIPSFVFVRQTGGWRVSDPPPPGCQIRYWHPLPRKLVGGGNRGSGKLRFVANSG